MAGQSKTLERMQHAEDEAVLRDGDPRRASGAHPTNVHPRKSAGLAPLSQEQYQAWLQTAMDPELPIGVESFTVRKDGAFDLSRLEIALNRLIQRHDILRTHLQRKKGEWMQVVEPEFRAGLDLIDLSRLPSEQREAEAVRIATKDAALPFDLTVAPLFRFRVLRMSAADHRFQITTHQVLLDSSSAHEVFASELAAMYAALEGDGALPPAETSLQYRDYAVWQRSQSDKPEHLDFWRSLLAGEIPLLRLPGDRPRPSIVSHRGAAEYFELPEDLMRSIRSLAGAHDASVYTVLLAAFNTMLFRYTGQQDVLVGGISDGRRDPELQRVMGSFSNPFILRTHPSAEQTFSGYLGSVRDTALAAMDAARIPFSRVTRMMERDKDSPHAPQLQAVLAFQPNTARLPKGWSVSRTKAATTATNFELHLQVEECAPEGRAAEECAPGAEARIVYSTDLFDAPTIRRMAGHWMTLLASAAENPELTLGELTLLSPEEREQMLVVWNQTEAPLPRMLLHDAVAEVARRNPEAIAVEFQSESCTYRQFAENINRIGSHLRKNGSKRGETVAVCMSRSQHLPAALLGVLQSGAAYLPLDPSAPLARTQICLEDAAPVILLTQRSLLNNLPPTQATVVLLEDCLAEEASASFTQEPIRPEDAAYIIHTSGSTGRPKAVEIPHIALMNLLETIRVKPGFASTDSMIAMATISFDIAQLEVFLPLIAGGRVIMVSRDVAQDFYLLASVIEQSCCTVLQATPATWRSLLDSGWKARPGLRVLTGGEPLSPSLAKRFLAQGVELWNLYGPTETTIYSTFQRITSVNQPISVGPPIQNTTTYILDARQQPVPIGIPGDLYIGGVGLANGYRNQPQLTAEKFTRPKVAGGERLYLSGDAALYRADGTIEIQGRTDNQVKIRGFRIELEEVEATLAGHPGVASVIAKAWPDSSGGHQLCAYVVGRGGPPPPFAELRQFLASRLPNYMIPSTMVALDALPVMLNGKPDRKALVPPKQVEGSPVAAATEGGSAVRNPATTPQERRLAAIWADLLCVKEVGLEENFFDLGGHSLLVARLQYRIDLEFGLKLPMAALFHAPTVAKQIELLRDREHGPSPSGILPIQPRGNRPRLFWIQPPPRIGEIAKAMGTNQPFFGVSITLAEMETLGPNPDLDGFARLYAEAITQFQSQGPYLICGFCAGGVLAYAVAARLVAQGHDIASLILLDADNPVFSRRVGSMRTELNKLWFYLRRTVQEGGFEDLSRHAKFRFKKLLNIPDSAATEMSMIENAIVAASARYKPVVYEGDVYLMFAEERPSSVNHYPGWKTVVRGNLTSVEVKGHHDDLVSEANVPSIANALSDCLTASQSNYSVAS